MEKLELPQSVVVKEIIRYEEEMYLLDVDASFYFGWEYSRKNLLVRADIRTLSELLRIENTKQTMQIEDVFLTMLTHGEPPRVDIRELTGKYLEINTAELVFKNVGQYENPLSINDLPQLVDVFSKVKVDSLGNFLNLEKEFSKEILEKVYENFQKTFALVDRGYTIESASSLMHTNNPISALIYSKIKEQFQEETTVSVKVEEEKLEENYINKVFKLAEKVSLPF